MSSKGVVMTLMVSVWSDYSGAEYVLTNRCIERRKSHGGFHGP